MIKIKSIQIYSMFVSFLKININYVTFIFMIFKKRFFFLSLNTKSICKYFDFYLSKIPLKARAVQRCEKMAPNPLSPPAIIYMKTSFSRVIIAKNCIREPRNSSRQKIFIYSPTITRYASDIFKNICSILCCIYYI